MTAITKQHIMGFENELKLHPLIEKTVGSKLRATSRFRVFDFINKKEKIIVELKSRTNHITTYPTTLINKSKIDYASKKVKRGYKAFLFFHFIDDSTYYIEYTDEWPYFVDKTYTYIPVDKLIKA